MIQLYNTLARSKVEFKPIDANNVRMYVCGPTVYDRAHLGNARSVVVYDVLYRVLKHVYPNVTYVRNITDVDDKINAAAKAQKITIQELTTKMTKWFHEDMSALNVLAPSKEPKATEHIKQMIAMIEALIKNNAAYAAQGHVLFSVKSDKNYGVLSGRVQEDLESGARVKVESYKKDPNDFVLWKPADKEDDASSVFDSPWGKGRPGWHLECSAMSTEYLGADFDIHGGGSDLMFPHHENEIAQSCGAYPKSHFAKYWVHNGFLTVNGEKMSKSLGNFITVRDLLENGVKPDVIRYAMLSTKYNEPLDWNNHLLETAKNSINRFNFALRESEKSKNDIERAIEVSLPKDFTNALSDDLNTPLAFSYLHELTTQLNNTKDSKRVELTAQLQKCLTSLGFTIEVPADNLKAKEFKEALIGFHPVISTTSSIINITAVSSANAWFKQPTHYVLHAESGNYAITGHPAKLEVHNKEIEDKINARIAAKKAKNWAEADKIRNELKAQGIILEDKPDGTTDWRRE